MPPDEEEANSSEQLIGFADVASFIAEDKEHSSSIYRRYEKLAARNLLYLQAELKELEVDLEGLDCEDARGGTAEMLAAMDWQGLRDSPTNLNSDAKEERRKELILKPGPRLKSTVSDDPHLSTSMFPRRVD